MIGGYGAELDDPPEEAAFFDQYIPQRFKLPELPDADVAVPEFGEPYAIEVWVEKSTANDDLEPLALELHAGQRRRRDQLDALHLACPAGAGAPQENEDLYASDHEPGRRSDAD